MNRVEVWYSGHETAESANARLATTEATHVLWLDNSGELMPDALDHVANLLKRFTVDLAYGDSVIKDDVNQRRVYRPLFSQLRLREQDFLGPAVVMAVEWMRSVGGFDPRAEGVHGYDFGLRYANVAARVVCIPEVLTVIRNFPAVMPAETSAVEHRLDVAQIPASVGERDDGSRRIAYEINGDPMVSVIIPTRGSRGEVRGAEACLVVDAVRGLMESTDFPRLEIVIVADDATPQPVIDELRALAGESLRLVRYSSPFNFSAKINSGAMHASGDYLLLLNDDVEIIRPDWITILLGLVQQPGVGMSGALLFFEDGKVQHGGHIYRDHWAGHIESPDETGAADTLRGFGVTREVSGVTAACSMLSADTFWKVGGLSLDFPGNYNDVDLCLKVRSIGKSIVFSPDAQLVHFESKTRNATITQHDIGALRNRWGTRLLIDGYWREEPLQR
ncbi:MAG: glycosyltransferase [Actinomycetota bacterium]